MDDGKRERVASLPVFPFPIILRALSSFSSPQPPYDSKRSLWRRVVESSFSPFCATDTGSPWPWCTFTALISFFIKQIAGSILFGAGCSGIHVALKLHSERGPHDQPLSSAENWSIFTDAALAPQAEKLIYHIIR